MPKYLGKICTVEQINRGSDTFHIEEDSGARGVGDIGWFWRVSAIEEIVNDDDFDESDFNLDLLLR